jgi:hypothetical protein
LSSRPDPTAADARSLVKARSEQWKDARATGTMGGETRPQFLTQCRAQMSGGGAAPTPPIYAPTPVALAPTYSQAAGAERTTSLCDAEYTANKAAIRASGQAVRAFVGSCRAGNETIPPEPRPPYLHSVSFPILHPHRRHASPGAPLPGKHHSGRTSCRSIRLAISALDSGGRELPRGAS